MSGSRMPPKEMDTTSYHQKYLNLKKKFKALLFENESFQEELRKSQRKLIRINKDKSFLLDRLLKYENVDSSTTDSEATVSSDTEAEIPAPMIPIKKGMPQTKNVPMKNGKSAARKKAPQNITVADQIEYFPTGPSIINVLMAKELRNNEMYKYEIMKKKRAAARKATPLKAAPSAAAGSAADAFKRTSLKIEPISIGLGDGHMTSEEIERHLEAKQSLRDLMPEKTPLTLPIEIFSNDPSEME